MQNSLTEWVKTHHPTLDKQARKQKWTGPTAKFSEFW
jgi:hypothetical protein